MASAKFTVSPQPFWIRYLPARIRARIVHRPSLQKALANIGWLFFDKILRMGVGLFVGVWVARYLGPEQFGLFSFAAAFVALFSVVATMGLDSIVVRDLVKEPGVANVTLGTAFVLQIGGGLLALILVFAAINFARPDDSLSKLIVSIMSLGVMFKAAEVVKYWFESQVKSRYTVWVENCAFLIFSAAKVALILSDAPLMAFAWMTFAEGLVVALGLFGVYVLRGGKLKAWRGHYDRAKTLFNDSWPLMLSGLTIMIYMRIDQIMLGQMLGDEAVGIYSAAVRISEMWYFIPMAIVASVFPSIVDAKKKSEEIYYRRLQKLYDGMVILAIVGALPIALASHWIVYFLFGYEYAGAGPILAINVWSAIFVFLGVASSKWFLLENMQRQAFYRTALGALVNVIANLILIPALGGIGAAFATLIAQIFAAYLFDLLNFNTRRSFFLKTASLLPFIPNIRARR